MKVSNIVKILGVITLITVVSSGCSKDTNYNSVEYKPARISVNSHVVPYEVLKFERESAKNESTKQDELNKSQQQYKDRLEDYSKVETDIVKNKITEIILEDTEDDLLINADKTELRRVICNLCGNAINYTPQSGKVRLIVKAEGNDIIFSVVDNGGGIPQEDIPNLFQRFSQGTSAKRSTGTGLGLYLSRQIIEAHGGKIWLESMLNKGSEFSFLLTDVIAEKNNKSAGALI